MPARTQSLKRVSGDRVGFPLTIPDPLGRLIWAAVIPDTITTKPNPASTQESGLEEMLTPLTSLGGSRDILPFFVHCRSMTPLIVSSQGL